MAVITSYIPGKLPGILITAQLGKKYGASRLISSVAMLMYQVMSLVSAGAIALVCLWSTNLHGVWGLTGLVAFAMALGLFIVRPFSLNWFIRIAIRLLKREAEFSVRTTGAQNATLFLLLGFAWLLLALAISLLCAAVLGERGIDGFFTLTGIFLSSQVVGAVLVMAPSGLGVFEAAMYFGLRQAFSEHVALALAALSRLVMVMPALIVYLWLKLTPASDKVTAVDIIDSDGSHG